MTKRREWGLAVILSLVVTGLTVLPYALAISLAKPHGVFSGFLINPLDGFSYLAKMLQGASGEWLFRLPYATQSGGGTLLFTYHILLGHIAQLVGLPLIFVYHSARAVGALTMFLLSFKFCDRFIADRGAKWVAFLLILLGSGLGWVGAAFGVVASDMWVAESIPFLSAYANAHFALATAALLAAVISVASDKDRRATRVAVALACGLVLGIIQPFAVIGLAFSLGVWLIWEGWRQKRDGLWRGWSSSKHRVIPYLALLAGAIPFLTYDLLVSRTHPALSQWSAQNLTPSLPLLETVLGFGLVLVLAIVGIIVGKAARSMEGRLMIAWAAASACLLYLPFGLERRMSLGLFFPLAVLAGMAVVALCRRRNIRLMTAGALVLVLVLPSNLVVVRAGLWGVSRGDPSLVLSQAEVDGYTWLAERATPGSLVLASPVSGNRIPAFAPLRVVYGHPYETPGAAEAKALVEDLYAWDGSVPDALGVLEQLGIDYVLYGPHERALGAPAWLASLPLAYRSGQVEVFQVRTP